jgi:hypothetical protein
MWRRFAGRRACSIGTYGSRELFWDPEALAPGGRLPPIRCHHQESGIAPRLDPAPRPRASTPRLGAR